MLFPHDNETRNKSIFLADDDPDDRILFEDALREICENTILLTAANGVVLMNTLFQASVVPDVIFLDLNMPLKNGLECLDEIKHTPELKNIPVIIFSTTARPEEVDKAYAKGANYYIRKPGNFLHLKKAIEMALTINWNQIDSQPSKEKFVWNL